MVMGQNDQKFARKINKLNMEVFKFIFRDIYIII